MGLFSMFVVYMLTWWTVLFAVLPMGVRGQAEEGDIVPGSEPGAPVKSQIKRKFKITTCVAAVIWAIICLIIEFKIVTWDDLAIVFG